ncbi:leucine-rich repeat-containing protein 36-like [Acipenser oxyrinchus oxyrinchus]|uniref:Leucine-rich repeat-containing protein 36-like n=1 Tax=Acipenser oxyrinchus oxyrinchus TaxID=40147 RepID=A0AAD8FYE5_ACIOX|nr:leucine-rich repeat-containing protein 36-like [Acipenser oxyrinchus oxyrinchus]
MAAQELLISENWIIEKADLVKDSPDIAEMKSLSLRGTHREKIRSFGEAFKHFTGLRLLDLSRNSIVSLEGIQHLISLEKLNLYYNNVPSLKEVSCLQMLSDLKELDLRLNPVTNSKEDYRLSVVSMLPKLEKLDERPVRDSERKSASSQDYKKIMALGKEDSSDLTKKKYGLDECTPDIHLQGKYKWSCGLNTDLDFNEKLRSRDPQLNFEPVDPWRYSSALPVTAASAEQKENATNEQKVSEIRRSREFKSSDLEEEYRPLPSPTRSSLRSPGKSPTRSKDGFRVTFSDSRAPADPARSSHVAEMDKALFSPGLSEIESTYLCKQHRSVNHAYQTPTPLRDETPANSYSDASSIAPRGSGTRLHAEKHAYKSPCVDLLQHQLDKTSSAESSTDRLLKLTSDLYLSTHINNEKATSASSGSSSKKSTVSIELPPQACMTTPDRPFDRSHPAPSVSSRPQVSRGLMDQLNSELLSKKKPSTPAQEKKRFPRPAEFSNSFSPRTELRRAGSLNSVLYTASDYKRREREATDLTGYHSQSPPSSSSQSISDISSVLKQLLDLVDRYWNGSKSLHLNRRFLTPAHDLLAGLTTSSASADSLQRSKAPTGRGVDSAELQQVNWQLMQTQEDQESLKRKVSQLLEENSTLQTQVPKTDTKTAASQTIDDLQQSIERLSLQVESLNQQMKQFRKFEEAVTMLQESHRSLVSTNDCLLQQLNKAGSRLPSELGQSSLASENTRAANGPSPSSRPSASSSRFSQYSRLSTCPL